MNIYVGNVPYAATEEDLEALFGEYGPVATATIIRDRYDGRSKGFGFVEMENQEDGERAIEALDGQEMMGRPLKVNPARPRSKRRYNGGGGRQTNGRENNIDSQEPNQNNKEETQDSEEKTHLILTVGTNALPVWVALFHLKKHLDNPKVGFVYTPETENWMECLKDYCGKGKTFNIVKTESGNPESVRKVVKDALNGELKDKPIHVHYTGGTQVMGVETVSTIVKNNNTYFDRSYLDARTNPFPTIIARMDGEKIDPQDARQEICPDICRIAELNGFQFVEPKEPEDSEAEDGQVKSAAQAVLQALKGIAKAESNRSNYAVYHNVEIKPKKGTSSFKFNVVVILGYQVIVVSCSTRLDQKKVKLKTMRAYHQAKQLGGDEARVVMLCKLGENVAADVEAELYKNIGSKDKPIQVWGKDAWDGLTGKFTNYLKSDLGWDSNSTEDTESSNEREEQSSASPQVFTEFNTGLDSLQSKENKDYLILTVGTEALPIWVAWFHLKKHLDNPKVGFVYTKETEKAMKCLKKHFKCNGYDEGKDFLEIFLTSPGNPKYVGETINTKLNGLHGASIHVHYTGGTQVMGVETAADYERSYLDARSEGGPTIRAEDNRQIGPPDAREGVCPDIHTVADLNGFQARDFHIYEGWYSDPQKFERDTLKESEKAKLCVAQIILTNRNNDTFSKNKKQLKEQLSGDEKRCDGNCSTSLPEQACNIWKDEILPKLNTAYPNCQWCLETGTLCPPASGDCIEAWKKDCKDMRTLLEGIWLEYVALDALEKTLGGIKCTRENNGSDYIRDNYALYRGVYVRRKVDDSNDDPSECSESERDRSGKHPKYFELDVVVVLGYQIVVVSCTTKTDKREVREKAIEAYLRAKQLGGDEARVIMLCNLSDDQRQNLEDVLKDDTGSKDVPLEVWGNEVWGNLSSKFKTYLKGLGWQ